MDTFLSHLAEQMQVEQVHREDVLQDLPDWDSLTILSVIAMIDARYNVSVGTEDLLAAKTVGDLEDIVSAKRK